MINEVQGRLMKRSTAFHTWKWRTCCLKSGRLQVFNDKGTLKTDVQLEGQGPVLVKRDAHGPLNFGFTITYREEKIHFCADSEECRKMWIDGIVSQCEAKISTALVELTTDKDEKKRRMTDLEYHQSTASSSVVCGKLRDQYSKITFPPVLTNGDILCGIGPIVRRVGWSDERILTVAFYIDAKAANKCLEPYRHESIRALQGDQQFYERLMRSEFRKTFVISCRTRTSRSVIVTTITDELLPRIGSATNALDEVRGFIEKSLKKGESMVLICDVNGTFEFRYKGTAYPPISSPELCVAIQAMFFDINSIQHDAKRGLIERLPAMFTGPSDANRCQSDANEITSTNDSIYRNIDHDPDIEEDIDRIQEEEQRRRDSLQVTACIGPLIETYSNHLFPGKLVNGSVLIGTSTGSENNVVSKGRKYAVGLYVDSAGMSEHLLQYKGLSVGTLLADPQFGGVFMNSPFKKSLVMSSCIEDSVEFSERLLKDLEVYTVADDIDTLRSNVSRISNLTALGFSFNDGTTTRIEAFTSGFAEADPVVVFSLNMRFTRAIQSFYFKNRTIETNGTRQRQLFQRIPEILDWARDDHVHTYQDEILMLKENYERQTPDTRVKVGYLLLQTKKQKWSKRWCRLDGISFAYYTSKRKKKPLETLCLSDFLVCDASEQGDRVAASPRISISLINEKSAHELVLGTDNVYDGNSWFEALAQASRTRNIHSNANEDSEISSVVTDPGSGSTGSLLVWLSLDPRNKLIILLLSIIVGLIANNDSWLSNNR